jgi:hypothetical protein
MRPGEPDPFWRRHPAQEREARHADPTPCAGAAQRQPARGPGGGTVRWMCPFSSMVTCTLSSGGPSLGAFTSYPRVRNHCASDSTGTVPDDTRDSLRLTLLRSVVSSLPLPEGDTPPTRLTTPVTHQISRRETRRGRGDREDPGSANESSRSTIEGTVSRERRRHAPPLGRLSPSRAAEGARQEEGGGHGNRSR